MSKRAMDELAWFNSLRVGDRVALVTSAEANICAVTSVSKSRRGRTVECRVRENWLKFLDGRPTYTGYFQVELEPVTPTIRRKVERQKLVDNLRHALTSDWEKVPINLLRRVASELEKASRS